MKIIVISDTHGNTFQIEKLLGVINSSDYLFFLGDGAADIQSLSDRITAKIIAVRGNCDYVTSIKTDNDECSGEKIINSARKETAIKSEMVATIGTDKFFLAHGNSYNVKSDYYKIAERAREQGCKFCLFGHTHVSYLSNEGDVILLNPGSFSTAYLNTPSYGVIEKNNNRFFAKIVLN